MKIDDKKFIEMSQENGFIDVDHMSDDLKNSLDYVGLDKEELKKIAGPDGKISDKEFNQLFEAVDKFEIGTSKRSFEYYDKTSTPDSPVLSKSGVLYEAMVMEVEKNRISGYFGPGAAKQKPLTEGTKGTVVKEAQHQINQWRKEHEKEQIKENGTFGHEMKNAVREFQEGTGLKPSGVFDNETRERLALANNENFKHIKGSIKKQIYNQLNEYAKDKKSFDNLQQLATDPYFARLSKEGQTKALERLANSPQSTTELKAIQDEIKDRSKIEKDQSFKKLDDSTKNLVFKSFESYALNPDGRKEFLKFATDDRFNKLSPHFQEKTINSMQTIAQPWDTGNVENLKNMKSFQRIALSPSFVKMDDPIKDRVLDLATKNRTDSKILSNLAKLTNDDTFVFMSKQDQVKTLNVFEATTPEGREALLTLLEKKVAGTSLLQTNGLKNTDSLISQLDRLATSKIDPRIADAAGAPADHAKAMESLLKELANPHQNINQDTKGTCTCTSMSFDLAMVKPAEYARIVTDLLTTGQSKLANGDTIQPPTDGLGYDQTNRSAGERLIQSALMNYATNGKYSNVLDEDGLNGDQQVKVLSAITGKQYHQVAWIDKLESTARGYLDGGRGPIYARFAWDDGGHAVVILKIENDRVYFRNPWGGRIPGVSNGVGMPDADGKSMSNSGPSRRVEDASNGIESISIRDFQKITTALLVEDIPD